MTCGGGFQQIRLGEMIRFAWDSTGDLVENPLDLGSSIDLGAANVVGITINTCSVALDGATNVAFKVRTAPINSAAFYTGVKQAGADAEITFTVPGVQFLSVQGFSRFMALAPTLTGPSPTNEASIVCTIDVVVRS